MEDRYVIELDKNIKRINEKSWPKVKEAIKKALIGGHHFKQQSRVLQLLLRMGLDTYVESMKVGLIQSQKEK